MFLSDVPLGSPVYHCSLFLVIKHKLHSFTLSIWPIQGVEFDPRRDSKEVQSFFLELWIGVKEMKNNTFYIFLHIYQSGCLYLFLKIQIPIWYHFLSAKRTSFNISYSKSLLPFIDLKRFLLCPHFLKISLLGMGFQISSCSLQALKKIAFYCLQAYVVYARKSMTSLIFILLYVVCLLPCDCY